jgi:predicted nucleic acid-binding protein
MRVLVDTNVLCRLAEVDHIQHSVASLAVRKLHAAGEALCLVPQVIYEYWVVATRPVQENGLGMTPADADGAVDDWLATFDLLRDERRIFDPWRDLILRHQVMGKSAHDTRLVAAMHRHDIRNLLTFNVADFRRYANIDVFTPEDVLNGRAGKRADV